jgi:HAE1 family hydrophobic/amphiphilic exporter-1
MTAFAFILGVVPLVLASGAGAHGRILLGLTVLGGMLAATLIAIFLIPVCFYVVGNLTHRGGQHEKPKPGGPASGTPRKTGDGELSYPVSRPALTPTPIPDGGSYGGGH